jgi:5S rRNA maturation endonuclease (ribonuclease M5)/Zn-finger protein
MDLKKIKQKLNENCETVFTKLNMKYERFGDNIYCTCPIHDSSDNPRAFSYSASKGIWKCWTRDCQHQFKNDIFGLIIGALSAQSGEDIDFSKALKWACKLLNINNTYTKIEQTDLEVEDDFVNMVSTINHIAEIYKHKKIDIQCNAVMPSKYFLNRGFAAETLEHFEVGDCEESSSKMRGRAIIPIHDDTGTDYVGMIGRTTKEYVSPKFLIYPKGFDKRHFFYNYHRAIPKAIETSCLYIVEGQGDVWKLYEAGVFNVVSIFGKTISKEQENKLIKLPITHLVILTDNDQAGREAKVQIKRQLSRFYKLTFPKMLNKDVGDMSIEQIQNQILSKLKGTY